MKKGNARYLKWTHHFGIDCHKTVETAYSIDKNNFNNLCSGKISKDMNVLRPECEIVENGNNPLIDINKLVLMWYLISKCNILVENIGWYLLFLLNMLHLSLLVQAFCLVKLFKMLSKSTIWNIWV